MQLWALIRDSFRESRDKKIFWVMFVVSTVAACVPAAIGFDKEGFSFFFGLLKKPSATYTAGSEAAVSFMAAIVSDFLIETYIAWIGVAACLIATAGIFPNFMENGAIDVVVSKPLSRVKVFAGKYIGSLGFVLVQSAYFVLLSFVILRIQIGVWLWGYLWAIPLLVALFSFLYCVCVLFSMWLRSGMSALVLTFMFWISIPGVAAVDRWLAGGMSMEGEPVATAVSWGERSFTDKVVHVLHEVLPDTSDIPAIVRREMGAATMEQMYELLRGNEAGEESAANRELIREEDRRRAELSPWSIVGSSLLFEAGVLALAGWIFVRRDF